MIRTLPLVAMLVLPTQALANDACGGLAIAEGAVAPTHALPAVAEITGDTHQCLAEIASALDNNRNLRNVTVTIRLPDEARADGSGDAILAGYVSALVGGGLAENRVSGVVASGDEDSTVTITYSERRSAAAVGKLATASGEVRIGASQDNLSNGSTGEALNAGTWVVTGSGARASVSLADGSAVRVLQDTELFLGKLHLDEDLNRVVELEIAKGSVEADVSKSSGQSTFQTRTPYGVAGVRGTSYRLTATDGLTRLETLEGEVALSADNGESTVGAGFGSSVDSSGSPTAPSSLPAAPRVKTPLEGPLPAKGLRWSPVAGSSAYTVELARDAEFLLDASAQRVTDRALVPDLDSGVWYWRIAAVDAKGFTGAWSSVHAFDVE